VGARGTPIISTRSKHARQRDHQPPHPWIVSRAYTLEPRIGATGPPGAVRIPVTRFDRFYEPLLVVLIAAVVFYGTL
jgi:hypothetical protein